MLTSYDFDNVKNKRKIFTSRFDYERIPRKKLQNYLKNKLQWALKYSQEGTNFTTATIQFKYFKQWINKKIFDQQKLKSINLSDCRILKGELSFINPKQFKNLQQITVKFCRISISHVNEIRRYNWINLIKLDMSFTQIGDKGAQYICQMNLFNLKNLNLQHCFISQAGFSMLSKMVFRELIEINLDKNMYKLSNLLLLISHMKTAIKIEQFQYSYSIQRLQIFAITKNIRMQKLYWKKDYNDIMSMSVEDFCFLKYFDN